MKKVISIFTAFTTILSLSGLLLVLPVSAVTFADGDLVRESDEFDVYIVKLVGSSQFKRLILNPDVFNMYGHLEWGDIQVVADGTLASYTTSELVRADGDEKVYKLFPDGDVGTKKWVDTLDCFNSQGYDWNSVYVINSFDRDSYTTASETMCGEVVVAGDITLSLASDTPGATTVPYDANSVTMTKIKIDGSGTISQVVIKRQGAGAVADIGNVYLYENGIRLTAGRSVSSATSKVTFINLDLTAPTNVEILVDFAASVGGNQHYFTLESASDVTSDATVGGSFPISGNPMALAGTGVGGVTVVDSGSTAYNVTIGEQDVEISQFKISVSTEAGYLQRIRLYNGGTLNSAKITDVKLKKGVDTIASVDAFGSNGYASFIFADPHYIKKGGNAILRVYADISGGKPDETIELYIELDTDIYAIGGTYGVGMNPAISGFDSTDSSEAIDVTLVGGDLTFSKIGPNAGNIALETDDTVFLEYSMIALTDVTISRTQLFWCQKDTGDSTYSALATNFSDVEDVKIVNKDTGVTWAGPNDGSTFTNAGSGYCPDGVAGLYKNFTDTYDLAAGEVYTMQLTGDVRDSDNSANEDLVAGDTIKLGIQSFSDASICGNANYMKYTGTTNSVACTVIVPSGDIMGEEFTLQTPSLTVNLAGTPYGTDSSGSIGTARSFVKGKTGVDIVGFVFTAGVASDVTITDLTLTSYIDDDGLANALGDGTYVAGLETGYVKNLVSSVEIYDTTTGAAIPGSAAKGFSGTTYRNVAYTGLSWVISAGESRTLLVKGNLSSTGPTKSTGFNLIAFDIANLDTDITSHDVDGNDIDEGTDTDASNGGVDPNIAIGVYNYGTLAIVKATDTPLQSVLLMDSLDNEVSKFKLTGTREAWYIEKYSVEIDENTASRSNFGGLNLKYQTEADWGSSNWTVSPNKVFANDATLSFDFTGDARPYIPKDDDSYITVLVDVDGYNAGTGAKSGDYTQFWTTTNSSNEFKVYGAESGKLLNGGDAGIYSGGSDQGEETKTNIANHYIFRSRPVFAKKAWSGDINELARFTITAEGYDVTFDGTATDNVGFHNITDSVVSAALEFAVVASGTNETTQILYLYDWNNDIISSVNGLMLSHADAVTENTDGTYTTTLSFQFEEATTEVVIAKDVTKEFYIMLDNTLDFNNQDEYIQLKIHQDEGATGANSDYNNCSIVWYDDTDDETTRFSGGAGYDFHHRICMPSSMNGIGSFPMSFRLLQGSQQ